MKRILLTFICFLSLFSQKAIAYTWEQLPDHLPHALPYTWNGNTYTHLAILHYTTGYDLAIYCQTGTDLKAYYNTGFPGAITFFPTTNDSFDCFYKGTSDDGETWESTHTDYTGVNSTHSTGASISSFFRSNHNVVAQETTDWGGDFGIGNTTAMTTVVLNGSSFGGWPILRELTVVRDPSAGGGVISLPQGDGIYCGVDSYTICELDFDWNSEVELEAYPVTDWAFGYWSEGANQYTDNPHTFTMDEARTVTSKFFKTFRNAVGSFYQSSGTYGNGECVPYVRYETGLPYAACNGNASTCFASAQSEGYSTGSTPRVGAVVVFDAAGWNNSIGHVGIVSAITGGTMTIQDQNFVSPGSVIGSHGVSTSQTDILGYIYPTP